MTTGADPNDDGLVDTATGVDAQPSRYQRRWARRRRGKIWLRRLGIGALVSFLTFTLASFGFNLVTRPPWLLDPGYGQYVKVGSAEVHYQQWGDHGSPIVLVPGFLESSIAWSAVGPLLGRHHRVYALDLPGHGYTRYNGAMTLSGQAELVSGFLAALNLRTPLLVGHSLGAAVVAEVALRHPDDLAGVVFADGDGLPIDLGPRWLRAAMLASPYPTSAIRLGARWTWAVGKFIKQSCGSDCPVVTNAFVRQWVRPLGQRSDEQALHALMLNGDYGLAPSQLAAVGVPTAIIWGRDDQQGGSLAAAITNLHHPPVHMIERAGHLSMLADPQAFGQAVESSLDRR